MNSLSKKQWYFHGPALSLLNSGNWNPALHPRNSIGEFIYTDGGLHGRSTSIPIAPNKTAKKSPQAIPYQTGYRRVGSPGSHFIKYDGTPPNSQTFTAPDGQTFLAPAGTDFQKVYNAGKTQGYAGMKRAVWQYGTFDFQRNRGGGFQSANIDNIFYSAYTNASNYAVGVYMNGAGAIYGRLSPLPVSLLTWALKMLVPLRCGNGRLLDGMPHRLTSQMANKAI